MITVCDHRAGSIISAEVSVRKNPTLRFISLDEGFDRQSTKAFSEVNNYPSGCDAIRRLAFNISFFLTAIYIATCFHMPCHKPGPIRHDAVQFS